ncbi:MAG: ABC transporter permease subunit [Oscillospiraceae bacterium]|nr:ABC transporter permease subunit [Oscillospiraceae bacterium]
MAKNSNGANKVGRSFGSMFKRLFVRDKSAVNILEEEALRTPGKTILLNLLHNKLAIIGFCGFVVIILFCFVGSAINPLTETYSEFTNANLRPGINYLKYPKDLGDKNIIKIVSGVSFSIALDDRGDLYIWGTECNLLQAGVSDPILKIPDEVKNARIVDIESGGAHIIARDDQGYFYAWGHYGHGQTRIPDDIMQQMYEENLSSIVKMAAMTRWTALLGDNGYVYLWGSLQSETIFNTGIYATTGVIDMAAGDNNMVLLHRDGTVSVVGQSGTEVITQVPPELQDGSVRVVSIAATNRNALALDDTGKLWLWGSTEYRLNNMPEIKGTPMEIAGGYKNLVVLTDAGEIIVWGSNELNQLKLPKSLSGPTTSAKHIFADYHQFYATDANGKILGAWGNKGYLWGSDQFGRDIFTRTMHGGKISLTVGIWAVIISTVIAIVVGLTSGYLGGWIDQGLMRLTDIFSALPFLPIVVTLNYVIGQSISSANRVNLLMILLGVLGWMGLARLIRAQLLLEREKDFVLAARSLGIKQRGIMLRHILPNVVNFVIVSVTLNYASFILSEAVFSFLGFGVPEPKPSWGNMLNSAMESAVIQFYWWRWIIPALFVVAAAFSINLVSDGLREAMDPKANER